MSLTSIKIKVKKFLPNLVFDLGLSIWRGTAQRILLFIEAIKLRRFIGKEVAELNYKNVSFKMEINSENGFIDRYIYLHGVYEDYILEVIAKYLPRNGVFFDLGANIGQHSLFAAAYMSGSGHVYAFEPLKKVFYQFQRSIELNNFNNISPYNYACGSIAKEQFLFTNNANMGQSSFVNVQTGADKVGVKVERLDDNFNSIQKIDLMKIDVEGFEYEVLLGAKELIHKTKPVIILEFSPYFYKKIDALISEKILDFLLPIYSLVDIDDGNKIIKNKEQYLENFTKRNRAQANILCLPKVDI